MESTYNTYEKSITQVNLEQHISDMKAVYKIDSVTQLVSVIRYYKKKTPFDTSIDCEIVRDLKADFNIFKILVSKMMYEIADECTISRTIDFIAKEYGGVWTLKDLYDMSDKLNYMKRNKPDTYHEIISICYIKLFSEKKKGVDKGSLHIDYYFKHSEFFVYHLRRFMVNTIKDVVRDIKGYRIHISPAIIIYDDGSEDKIDSIKYNSMLTETSHEEQVCRLFSYDPDMAEGFICAILDRFMPSRPVACYIYFKMLLEKYDPVNIVAELETYRFDSLFIDTLENIKEEFNVDLSYYETMINNGYEYMEENKSKIDSKNKLHKTTLDPELCIYVEACFNASNYIDSLKKVKVATCTNGNTNKSAKRIQRDRIDRLASETRRIVHSLKAFDNMKEHVGISKSGSYWCYR